MTDPVTVPVKRAEYERLIRVTESLINEVSDPGTEALAAVWCARRILDQAAMLAAASKGEPVGEIYHARQIAEVMDEGDGFWRPCSGCQESVDGYVSERDYPYNKTFRCQPGGGCSECGGLGVLWDDTDYEQMAREMIADEPLQTTSEPLEATGGKAVIRNGQIVISIDVDALPIILSGSIALNAVSGTFKVTDADVFAQEVCIALNDEKEDGTTRVHMMFDGAFDHAIDHGAEGVEEITEDEFEDEASRLQELAKNKGPQS